MRNKIIGDIGESLAINYLKEKKYKILEINFSNCIGEIDIIAKKNNNIIFIEVKNRSSIKFGLPRESVNWKKQQKIRNVALSYLKLKRLLNTSCRFDVIDILEGKITHIKNCF